MKKLLTMVILMTISTTFAGIKDKKAKRNVTKTVSSELATVKKLCGNKKLTAKIDFKKWDTYKYKTKDLKLKYIGHLNSLVKEIYSFMGKVCKDPDYKAEISKVTTISFSGKKELKDYDQASFSLKGTTLNVQLNADGVGSWKNENSLKAAWE